MEGRWSGGQGAFVVMDALRMCIWKKSKKRINEDMALKNVPSFIILPHYYNAIMYLEVRSVIYSNGSSSGHNIRRQVQAEQK